MSGNPELGLRAAWGAPFVVAVFAAIALCGLGTSNAGAQGVGLSAPASETAPSATAQPAPPPAITSPAVVQSAAPATQSSNVAKAEVSVDGGYVLGPSDVIEVNLLGVPNFTTRDRISDDGTIKLPYLGAFPAANKTSGQLSDDIAHALEAGGFFNHPIVKIDVGSYASRYVTVLGNFTSPGLVPVDRAYHLSEIIARVGGVRETGADYVVLHFKRGGERRITIESLATGDTSDDPLVSPGDKIYSPQAALFYISGQVKSPGVFPMSPEMTFRMAVSRGGGVTDAGSLGSLTVTREGKKLGHVDLDSKVLPGDVIVIGERLF